MKRQKSEILFGSVSTLLIFLIAGGLVVGSRRLAENENAQYPSYAYQDYVDRSSNFLYQGGAGGQLYEAEKGQFYGDVHEAYNQMASGRAAVSNLTPGSKIQFRITSDTAEKVLLTLRICYFSQADADASALDLLSISVNNEPISLEGMTISRCESDVTFKENRLALFPLIAGENLLDLTSLENSYSLDYLVLTPLAKRSVEVTTIGVNYRRFFAADSTQLYETEESVFEGSVPIQSESASGLFYLRNDTAGGVVSFYLDADSARNSPLSVSINNYSSYPQINALYALKVNGVAVAISDNVRAPFEERGGAFDQVQLANIDLIAGKNEITLDCLRGRSSLDYLTLNSDLGFAQSRDSQRYEAENLILSDNLKIRASALASGAKDITGFAAGEKATLNFTSAGDKSVRLALSLAYTGSYPHLGDFLSLRFNGEYLNLSSVTAEKTLAFNYFEADCGLVEVLEGDNTLEITGTQSSFAVDAIDFSSSVLSSTFVDRSFEAENAITAGGSHIEFSKNASGGRDIGFNDINTAIAFAFYCESAMKLRLSAYMSINAVSSQSAADNLFLSLNHTTISLANISLAPTGGWFAFQENVLGELDFRQGYNLLSFFPRHTLYNLDAIRLVRVLQ